MRVVVIGSGPNGLAAAVRLAENGMDVTVLEAADEPGGAVRTGEVTLPGFRHDLYSAVHPAARASPVFARMPLADHGLRWIEPEACYAHPLDGGRAALLYRDLDRTARELDALTGSSDGDRWAEFAAPFASHFGELRDAMLDGFPPVRSSIRLARALGARHAAGLGRLLAESSSDLAHRLFTTPEARAWLLGCAVHADVPPSARGGAVAVAYLSLLGHGVGWPSPAGGAGAITDALMSYLRSLGGSVVCGARAERIDVAGGRVRAVEIAGGDAVGCDAVVASVMPQALLRLAGDAVGRGPYRALMSRYRYGPAAVKVDWALDGPIPWAAPEVARAGCMHVAGSDRDLTEAIDTSASRLPARPYLLMGQQSTADPSRAPVGEHTAWAYTRSAAPVAWSREVDAHVERMEAQVERFAPGFRDRILGRHVLGPAELESQNANLVGGDVGGGTYRGLRVMLRPLPTRSPYRTPVSGVYLGSAATFPGAAVHGVGGDAAARALLADRQR